jgi:hypothetical protein
MTTKFLKWACLPMLAGLYICTTGCQSLNNSSPATMASVTITNQSMASVGQAIAGVFASKGYEGGQTSSGQFNYNRLGSRINNLAYGTYMFEETITVKVQVNVSQTSPNTILIGCQAWLVEGYDNTVFGDGPMIRPLRKWPYAQLLQDIQRQLGE